MGDGTVYGSASSAAPNVSQKTFALTGFSWIADVGADSDDKFNGYFLYFPASGNRYHIVDWVAATDTATVYENPASTDTGACEIRRGLWAENSLASNPAHRLADGQLFATWKGSAPNQGQNIDIHLPNLIGQGGFEELAVGAFPAAYSAKGKWFAESDWTVSATSPLLGSRMAEWVPGAADAELINTFVAPVKSGRKYRIICKAQAVTGATNASAIQIYIDNRATGISLVPGFTGGNPWSLGAIGTTAAWFTSPDFTVGSDSNEARIDIVSRIANKGVATAVRIDEIYFFEQVNVGALLVFGHKWEGMPAASLFGYNCPRDRSNITVGVERFTLASPQAVGSGAYLLEFAPAIYPIYRINLNAFSLYAYEAAEILLAEKWAWGRHIMMPFDPELIEKEESLFRSRLGVEQSVTHSRRRRYKGQIKLLSDIDRDIWLNDWYPHHHDPRHPFAVRIDAARPVVLMNDAEGIFGMNYESVRPTREFNWLEVVK